MTLPLLRGEVSPSCVASELDAFHYLGATGRGWAWVDERGIVVLASPTSRMLPIDWLELSRWLLRGEKNAGSQQWAELRRHILEAYPGVTTVVSYSDPAVGHTGALYRACNWLWAPTWHRLRPPPTGGGQWGEGRTQAPKDRWVAPLRPDDRRPAMLTVNDASILRRWPWLAWQEPRFKRGVAVPGTGGVDRDRWARSVRRAA